MNIVFTIGHNLIHSHIDMDINISNISDSVYTHVQLQDNTEHFPEELVHVYLLHFNYKLINVQTV